MLSSAGLNHWLRGPACFQKHRMLLTAAQLHGWSLLVLVLWGVVVAEAGGLCQDEAANECVLSVKEKADRLCWEARAVVAAAVCV